MDIKNHNKFHDPINPNSSNFAIPKEIKIQKPVNCFLKRSRPHYEINPIKNKLMTIEEASGIYEKEKDPEKERFMEDKTFWQLIYHENESATLECYEAFKGNIGYLEITGKKIIGNKLKKLMNDDKKVREYQ